MKHPHSMTRNLLTIAVLALTAFALGCDREPTTSQQFDKVQAEAKHASQDMKDYAYAQKGEFVTNMQAQLAEINRDLDQLAAKVDRANAAAKADAAPRLQALRDQVAKLNTQLDAVKNASESTWGEVKDGFKKGYSELKDGFNQARQWVSDKIAP